MSILGSICNLPFSGHHDLYDIISSWEVEQNQAVKAATQGKASPAKNQTPGKEPIYGQKAGASDNRFIFQKRLFKSTREIPGDPVEVSLVSLLFAQAVHSAVRCDELSRRSRCSWPGCRRRSRWGSPKPSAQRSSGTWTCSSPRALRR